MRVREKEKGETKRDRKTEEGYREGKSKAEHRGRGWKQRKTKRASIVEITVIRRMSS